ncbi:TonB-dependent receptor domain-containing protein [Dongshaea marina]|uniref:TonB-dependent receptor domain-containing protein n=1 Tax=Dongshaea marina TaxID=2047966 RepID=UPI000D3E6C64|nr:TonB-dependent receptor [Dongshaea marina]
MSKLYLAALLLPAVACAQSQPAQNETSKTPDETFVISANHFPQAKASVLAPVEVVTAQQIQKMQAKTLVDVLNTLPGVQVKQLGGPGHQASIQIQGASSSEVLVLVDGMRTASSSYSGSVDLSQLPLNSISRIEYIRGARASIYGSDAMGGVINLITRDPQGEQSTLLDGTIGSRNYAGGSLVSSFDTTKNGHLKVALDGKGDRGYNIKPVSYNDGHNYGFESYNGLVGYSQQLATDLDFYGTVRHQQSETKSVGFTSDNETWVENTNVNGLLRYQHSGYGTALSAGFGKYKMWNGSTADSKGSAPAYTSIRQYQSNWSNTFWLTPDWTLGAGLDWRRDQLMPESISYSQTFDAPNHRDNTGAYSLVQYQHGVWSAELSGRADHNEQYNNHQTWSIGGGWSFAPGYQAKLSYGTSFRAPSLMDLYFPGYENPELKPEKGKSWQLTLSGQPELFSWELNAFDNRVTNKIVPNPSTYIAENIGQARVQGVTGTLGFTSGIASQRLHATYQRPKNEETGQDIQLTSRWLGGWQGDIQLQQLRLGLQYDYTGQRLASDKSSVLGGYSLWTATASYQLDARWTLKGRIDNLLDKRYQTDQGYPSADRGIYVGVSCRI